MKEVIKRDGRVVPFDQQKVVIAVESAMSRTNAGIDHALSTFIAQKVDASGEKMSVEQIQDLVETLLMNSDRKEVAKEYILYRAERTRIRERNSSTMQDAFEKISGTHIENSNANVDEASFGGRKNEASSVIQKQIALDWNMSPAVADAHRSGLIYQHDLDSYNVGMHNCFERSTRFITAHGVRSFEDFNDGDHVQVLTPSGYWREAVVRRYGEQMTYVLQFSRGRISKTVVATRDHRWILRDGSTTDHIEVGDELMQAPNIYDNFDWDHLSPNEKRCWCHGFILGDGCRIWQKSKVTGESYLSGSSRVRLCGDKARYITRFEECGYHRSSQYYGNGDIAVSTVDFDKTIPDPEQYSASELMAWVHGLYDADGAQTAYTVTGKKRYSLQSSSMDICGFIKEVFPTAGLYISSTKDKTGQSTNYGTRDYTVEYRFTPNPTGCSFKLVGIEEYKRQDVWCLEVEDEHAFVLDGGMVTGNCLFADISRLFRTGFSTRNGDVRPPTSYSTACQLLAVIFQLQSQDQFGGVASAHVDRDLAPFVTKSFEKHIKDGLKYVSRLSDEDIQEVEKTCEFKLSDPLLPTLHPDAWEYAMDMLEREGRQSTQALYHNLNTLESRAGSQVPFTSLNYGRDTSPEGRMVTRWILEASIDGIGQHHTTPIFPIGIFSYKKGVNAYPSDPNYDLKQLALKSMSMRIYPNWCFGDYSEAHEDPNDIDTTYATMGCRTAIGFDRNGLGYKRVGRGNNIPITIILPMLGIEYGICQGKREKPDLAGFWEAFESTLKLTEKAFLERFEILKRQSPKAAPFMYDNGTIADADKCTDNVYEALKHNTFAIGYIGIAEMCQALFGKDHADDTQVHAFALKVVERINRFAKEAGERNGLNFGCYATPAESLCMTAMNKLKKQYGIIPNVTDREYLTNSHHVPVWKTVSIFDKLRIEAPFCRYPTAGCITYIECDSMFVQNLDAVEDIIDYASNLDIPYLAFNFPIDTCLDCGYQGEFDNECPECGGRNIQQLRRVTGYLSVDYRRFNDGKQHEVEDRIKHTAYTTFGEDK